MKEKDDVRRVTEEAERIAEEIAALATELEEEMAAVTERYSPEHYPVESFSITPRRSDIFDVSLYLQWEPRLDFAGIQGNN